MLYDRVREIIDSGKAGDVIEDIKSDFDEAHVIRVNNVAKFYFMESPQDIWFIERDFPNIAPPWPSAWFEWETPGYVNYHGVMKPSPVYNMGMLIRSRDFVPVDQLAPEEHENIVREYGRQLIIKNASDAGSHEIADAVSNCTPDEVWNALDTKQKEDISEYARTWDSTFVELGIRWVCNGFYFCITPHSRNNVVLVCKYIWLVTGDGRIGMRRDINGETHPLLWAFGDVKHDTIPDIPLHVPFLAMSFAHCKNVSMHDVVPPEKLARRHMKRHGTPKVIYKILTIDSMRDVLRKEGKLEHTGIKRAMHICRGHFAHYETHGLFGKYTGTFWRPMHVKGKSEHGEVRKSYKVEGKK